MPSEPTIHVPMQKVRGFLVDALETAERGNWGASLHWIRQAIAAYDTAVARPAELTAPVLADMLLEEANGRSGCTRVEELGIRLARAISKEEP